MKIIDCHHHYWHPKDDNHPWLCRRPLIPFRYGDYSAICKPFMPDDYDEVTRDWQVVATVTMEGEWNPDNPVGELEWLQALKDKTGRPAAHSAQAWLDRDDFLPLLDQMQAYPFVRSIRHKPRSNPAPGGAAGGTTDKAFIAGFCALAEHGLHFELQTPWWHLHEAMELSDHSDQTLLIINHAGLPSDRSTEGLAAWEAALREFSVLPQARIKISGLGVPGEAWTTASLRHVVLTAIDVFGVDRCMFASNFPVDSLFADFDTIYSGFDQITSDFTDAERDLLFHTNAARVYAIDI